MSPKKAQTGPFVLHQAIAKVREHYNEDVEKIAQQLLHMRENNEFNSADEADNQLYEFVTSSTWMNDNHEGLVLYLSSNRNIMDVVGPHDDNLADTNPVFNRALCAMEADVCRLIWNERWSSLGERYRNYAATPDVRVALKTVLELGKIVCDQLGADKNRSQAPDTVEVKLLFAIEELERILT